MPDALLIFLGVIAFAGLFVGVIGWLCGDITWRSPFSALCFLVLIGGWLAWASRGYRSAIESEFYEVQTVTSPAGTLTQVIATKDDLVNLNEKLKTTIPPGKRVHRLVYSGWRRGVYFCDEEPEYTIAD